MFKTISKITDKDIIRNNSKIKIAKGKQKGTYARLYPINSKLYIGGSDVIAYICVNCGHILSMKVEKPERFK